MKKSYTYQKFSYFHFENRKNVTFEISDCDF